MRRKDAFYFTVFLALLLIVTFPHTHVISEASKSQDLEFEVISCGDISGYVEEAYVLVKDEVQWAEVWKKHTGPYVNEMPCPEIVFSEKMVVCAFMGERHTAGYRISVEKIWADEEKVHVEIVKDAPPKDSVVAQVLTYPYVFVSLERTDADVVFHVTEESGAIVDYVLPEFPLVSYVLTVFAVLSGVLLASKIKLRKFRLSASSVD